jgi:homopolymeric O-antigen transport system ATP-binding protein
MGDVAIRVVALSKQYRIGERQERYYTLRDTLTEAVTRPFQKLASFFSRNGADSRTPGASSIWALKDVSFEVKPGEVVGIIGRNGAGKSTLLKILSRITEPTAGRAEIHGRVGSLLEVGTGFHPELTGRENIYLNGAILGMKKAEIDRKFDEIVAFAEVEQFIDTPVKHYSSGMYLRLAFAVAAHLEQEILIVDEVLAVGDAAFQKKCLEKMGDVANKGRTILFVSHNMAAITRLCRWGIWLDSGKMEAFSTAEEIVARYLASDSQEQTELKFPDDPEQAPGSDYIRLLGVRIKNSDGMITRRLDIRLPFTIEMQYRILRRARNLRTGFWLTTPHGTVVLCSLDADKGNDEMERFPGTYVSSSEIPGDFFNHGQYSLSVGSDSPMIQTHFRLEGALTFQVEPTGGLAGHIPDGRRGILRVRLPWKIQKID